jgi:hypothetical protein
VISSVKHLFYTSLAKEAKHIKTISDEKHPLAEVSGMLNTPNKTKELFKISLICMRMGCTNWEQKML